MGIYHLAAFFFIYSLLGWCAEVVYAAVKNGRFINRGFLNGPICPIYGVGVVAVIYCLEGVKDNIILLYLASVLLVTVIEGLTGLVLDKIFHHKWWDYSSRPLNIGGYVCLLFSMIWGLFCVFIVTSFQPVVKSAVEYIPVWIGAAVLVCCTAGMAADLYVTASGILKLNRRLEAMEKIASELRELSDRMGANIYENVKDGMEQGEKIWNRMETVKRAGKEFKEGYYAESKELYEEMQSRIRELWDRYEKIVKEKAAVGERLMRAFPRMESRRYRDALQLLKESLGSRRK